MWQASQLRFTKGPLDVWRRVRGKHQRWGLVCLCVPRSRSEESALPLYISPPPSANRSGLLNYTYYSQVLLYIMIVTAVINFSYAFAALVNYSDLLNIVAQPITKDQTDVLK